ncbi:uncharacterized protein FOMMEDRAFT_144366 [Fomitiporia mediterranea MF3/22]|uniref:uncharacterized protein n=1 Tax=Fomitiporia mediterranea (strain MF3/22) TaxID=694068 RepID=UPI0004408BDC|nr:uncharacterized protein FOMMEDRAFT_144366 [Fomitiporia mediterranea MF3/22]EJD08521.1 hypothetical protein FOMMEDRAFT_144366 [Fomitiporia mediterranea MF3/22]
MPPPANTMTMKRINREIKDLGKEDLGDMTLEPEENNMFVWKASIPGPEGSPYEGGVFNLKVELAQDYPFSAPKFTFTTRIYHMNVSDRGNICIDILKQNWSPALSLYKVLLSLSSLLTDPNPKDPLVPAIASQYVRSRSKHDSTAREWTRLYAQKPAEPSSPPSRAKGKARAEPTATSSVSVENGRTGRARRAPQNSQPLTNGGVIDISEMDDGLTTSRDSGRGGARTRTGQGTKRKRDLDDSTNAEGDASRRRRISPERTGEVIVIED